MIPPLESRRQALSISGIITYMTINNLSILTKDMTTASASLGAIVKTNVDAVFCIHCLTTFGDDDDIIILILIV
jgi:hypothetical protein